MQTPNGPRYFPFRVTRYLKRNKGLSFESQGVQGVVQLLSNEDRSRSVRAYQVGIDIEQHSDPKVNIFLS